MATTHEYRHYLKEWREHFELSQRELARRVGVAYGLICRYENGTRGMSLDMQFRLMRTLGIEPWQFFYPPGSARPSLAVPKAQVAAVERELTEAPARGKAFGAAKRIPNFMRR